MVTSGEVLSLATPWGATMGKLWLLLVSRSLENAFATIVDLKNGEWHWCTYQAPTSKSMYFFENIFIFCEPETLFYLDIYT